MQYSKFREIVLKLKKHGEMTHKAMDLKIDLLDFCNDLHEIIVILIKEEYGEEGYDWFSWFCYDSEYGEKDWSEFPLYKLNESGEFVKIKEAGEKRAGAYDEKNRPICYTIRSTWEYLEQNYAKRKKKTK